MEEEEGGQEIGYFDDVGGHESNLDSIEDHYYSDVNAGYSNAEDIPEGERASTNFDSFSEDPEIIQYQYDLSENAPIENGCEPSVEIVADDNRYGETIRTFEIERSSGGQTGDSGETEARKIEKEESKVTEVGLEEIPAPAWVDVSFKLNAASKAANVVDQSDEEAGSTSWVLYPIAFFIVVASVLGTGILGLPVKLAECGFWPFMFSYFIGFVMQGFTLLYMVELLQRTKAVLLFESKGAEIPANGSSSAGETAGLHSMGKIFLRKYSQIFFIMGVLLHFLSILITYGLAGSMAWSNMLEMFISFGSNSFLHSIMPFLDRQILIYPFIIGLTLLVIFGSKVLEGIISVMTSVKGSLLVILVIVTAIVGVQVNHPISDEWIFVGKPFLVGTVALGGSPFVIPVIFYRLKENRKDTIYFCLSILAGLFVVYSLNVIWAYYVLRIVPQRGDGPTLEKSGMCQEISTIPLTSIIVENYPQYAWIAIVINIFITASVTVSFITMAVGLKHALDGFVKDWSISAAQAQLEANANNSDQQQNDVVRQAQTVWNKIFNAVWKRKLLLYAICFGLIFILAVLNPHSFLSMMEVFTSLGLNLEAGVFMIIMISAARSYYSFLSIPFPMPAFIYHMRWGVAFYFCYAVAYDFGSVIVGLYEYVILGIRYVVPEFC